MIKKIGCRFNSVEKIQDLDQLGGSSNFQMKWSHDESIKIFGRRGIENAP